MTVEYVVITKILEGEIRGNLANVFVRLRTDDVPVIGGIGPMVLAWHEVFILGEVLICQGGREICGQGRKPSKWYVEHETFNNVEDAIECSKRVTNERTD